VRSAEDSRAATRLAFDRLAADYDALTGGEIFQLLRSRTHRVFARSFAVGARVLEIGCGTGADTQFLAESGLRVIACDPSEEMVSRTLRRLAREGLDRHATVVPCGLEDLQAYLAALDLPDTFDGIVSNFGALNCVPHLAPLAALVRRHLAPGGLVILGLMTRVCAVEAVYFTATKRPGLVRRRLGGAPVDVPVAGVGVPTYYHRIKAVCEALARDATLTAVEGIGVTIPPPYLEPRWQKLPRRVRMFVTTVDGWLAQWPPFNRVGDHVLLLFTKEGGAHA
jgi:SAM-dependent methyltransferase